MIDALIAIVIFSIGILGMVTLQSAAVNMASSAKYRTDAAMLADQVVAQMWASNNATAGVLATQINSPNGTAYKAWASRRHVPFSQWRSSGCSRPMRQPSWSTPRTPSRP